LSYHEDTKDTKVHEGFIPFASFVSFVPSWSKANGT